MKKEDLDGIYKEMAGRSRRWDIQPSFWKRFIKFLLKFIGYK